jgi:L-threonylcarbamoyladenylate synthase
MQLFDAASLSDGAFKEILSFLRAGGVIGFPTDTAYGLGADAFNETAVRRIFEIKGRPESKPILLLVNSMAMAQSVAIVSDTALALARRFWPGPLTMVFQARPNIPALVTAGTGTVGLRWARAPFAERILQAVNRPLTATSANRSGAPSTVTAEEVRLQLEGRLEMLIDGGALPARGGSTLLDLTCTPPRVLREGPISKAELGDMLK